MIYLIQDCYKDENNNYIDILKIGYSDKPFMESRNSHYKTHNYGYKFIGEREGDTKFEHYLHEKFKSFRLSNESEWFIYDSSIVNEFLKVSENEKDVVLTKEQYISNIQFYLFQIFTKPKELYKKYRDLILKGKSGEKPVRNKKELFYIHNRIKFIFNHGYRVLMSAIRNDCNIDNSIFDKIPSLIHRDWLNENPLEKYAVLYYKLIIEKLVQDRFYYYFTEKVNFTDSLLKAYNNSANDREKKSLAIVYRDRIKSSKYLTDFISISSQGTPIKSNLVMDIELLAFNVFQEDCLKLLKNSNNKIEI